MSQNYLDYLMANYPLDTDSMTQDNQDQNKELKGGQQSGSNRPTGGFPPIYLCDDNMDNKTDSESKREYTTHKTAISIKDIMEKRRNITPMINLQ